MANGIRKGLVGPAAAVPPAGPEIDQEARDRELIERLAASPPLASTIKTGVAPRGWRGAEGTARRRTVFGWKTSLILDLLMIASPIPLVLAAPPFLECRDRQTSIGFFVGESLASCTQKGVQDRWRKLDSRLKMLVRDSGH